MEYKTKSRNKISITFEEIAELIYQSPLGEKLLFRENLEEIDFSVRIASTDQPYFQRISVESNDHVELTWDSNQMHGGEED